MSGLSQRLAENGKRMKAATVLVVAGGMLINADIVVQVGDELLPVLPGLYPVDSVAIDYTDTERLVLTVATRKSRLTGRITDDAFKP